MIVFAEQCFLNEFIYFQSTEERDYLKKIEKRINNGKTICELDILLVSLYKPLNKLKYLKQKLEKYISNSKEFNDFLKYVFHDPNNDEVNSSLIKPMSNFSNKISKLMKKQYEENPYPRWRFTLRPIKGNYLKKFPIKLVIVFLMKIFINLLKYLLRVVELVSKLWDGQLTKCKNYCN